MLIRAFDMLAKSLCIAFGVALATSILLVFTDVVLRNMGIVSFPWVVEVAEYAMYTGTFLAAPWVLRTGGHVRVELLVDAVPKAIARLLDALSNACGLAVSGTLLYYGSAIVLDGYVTGTVQFKTLTVPEWILLLPIPIGSAVLCIAFVLRMMDIPPAVAHEDASLPQGSI